MVENYNIHPASQKRSINQSDLQYSQNQSDLDNSMMRQLKQNIKTNYINPQFNNQYVAQESQVFSNQDDISLTDSQLDQMNRKNQENEILRNQMAQEILQEKISHENSRSGSRKTSQRSNMFDGSEHDERVVFINEDEQNKLTPGIKKLSTKGESQIVEETPTYVGVQCNGVATVNSNYTCNGKDKMTIVVKSYVGRKNYTVSIKETAEQGLEKYLIGDLKTAGVTWDKETCTLYVNSSKIFSMIFVALIAFFAF